MPLEQNSNFDCPYCGAANALFVDVTGGRNQHFVVDCETCCAPILVRLKLSGDEIVSLDIQRENE